MKKQLIFGLLLLTSMGINAAGAAAAQMGMQDINKARDTGRQHYRSQQTVPFEHPAYKDPEMPDNFFSKWSTGEVSEEYHFVEGWMAEQKEWFAETEARLGGREQVEAILAARDQANAVGNQ